MEHFKGVTANVAIYVTWDYLITKLHTGLKTLKQFMLGNSGIMTEYNMAILAIG